MYKDNDSKHLFPIINKGKHETLSNQIANFYIKAVITGDLKFGDIIPSKFNLIKNLNISDISIRSAWIKLKETNLFKCDNSGMKVIYNYLGQSIYVTDEEFYEFIKICSSGKTIAIKSIPNNEK